MTAAAAILGGHYDPGLVALSILIAILASATALDIASRIPRATRRLRLARILGAGAAMGGGIWAMHFVAMLALSLPVTIGDDIPITLVSLVLAVGVTSFSMLIAFSGSLGPFRFLLGGMLMGAGIAGMHFAGMTAVIVIAIGASIAALWIAARVPGKLWRLGAAVVLGLAVAVMHYASMAAIRFTRAPAPPATARIGSGGIALAVIGATFAILGLAVVAAALDRRFATWRQREMEALRNAAARTGAALRALEAAQQSLMQFKAAVEHSSASILILDRDGLITYANPMLLHNSQYSEPELLGQHLRIFRSDANPAALYEGMWAKLLSGESWRGEMLTRPKDGVLQWNDVSISPITNAAGEITHFVVLNDDISERKKLEAELRQLATIDPLTGLLNRRSFFTLAEQEISRQRRHPGKLSVAMIDVDHFKSINDLYGHQAGDAVLRGLAEVCSGCMRETDILGRLGGEEFACVLAETSLDKAFQAAERLRFAVSSHKFLIEDGCEIRITVSIGVAVLEATDSGMEVVLQRADQALYAAKQAGRDCIRSAA